MKNGKGKGVAGDSVVEPEYDQLDSADSAELYRSSKDLTSTVAKIEGATGGLKSAMVIGHAGRNWSKVQSELRALQTFAGEALAAIGKLGQAVPVVVVCLVLLAGCNGERCAADTTVCPTVENSTARTACPDGKCPLK